MAPNIQTRTLRDYVNSFPRVDDAQLVITPELTVGSSPISIDGVNAGTAINIDQSNPQRPSVSLDIASQAQAESGVLNDKGMTPLRTAQEFDALSPITRVERSGSDDTGTALNAAISAIGYSPKELAPTKAEYLTTQTILFTKETMANLLGATIKQPDNTNLDKLVFINQTEAVQSLRSDIRVFVDGNRANNVSSIVGVNVSKYKKAFARAVIGAVNCDTGVLIDGDAEYAKFDFGVQDCGVGVEVRSSSGVTSDELMIDMTAHVCDTFFKTTGAEKTSGNLRILAEQCNGFGLDIQQGWWDLYGEIRAVGLSSGGGIKVSNPEGGSPARVSGNLMIAGGDVVNCEWAADMQAGIVDDLRVRIHGEYASGVRINSDIASNASMMICNVSAPASGPALRLEGAGTVNGFHLLPGSRLQSTTIAIDAIRASECLFEPTAITGSVVIGAASKSNTFVIPRRSFGTVSFVNNDADLSNHIIFRGRYTLAQLNARTDKLRGMRAEMVADFQGAAAYFDGTRWVPEYGVVFSGVVTVLAGSMTGSNNHALGLNYGNGALTIYPGSSLGSATKWSAALQTNFVVVTLDAAPGVDVTFPFSIRKVN